MARKLALLLVGVLLLGGVAAVRASAWTPFAPAPLAAVAWAPIVDPEPAHWQTLDWASFEVAGGAFVAELQGFRHLTSGGVHAFVVRIVRTGGEPVPVAVQDAFFESSRPTGVDLHRTELALRFSFYPPGPGPHAVAADVYLDAWRPLLWGHVHEEGPSLRLRAEVERRVPGLDAADGPALLKKS